MDVSAVDVGRDDSGNSSSSSSSSVILSLEQMPSCELAVPTTSSSSSSIDTRLWQPDYSLHYCGYELASSDVLLPLHKTVCCALCRFDTIIIIIGSPTGGRSQSDQFIRPPDIIVGRLKFYCESSSSIVFLFQLAERNSTKTGHILGSQCDLKMHVRNLGYNFPLKSAAQKLPFSTISQLNRKFHGLYLWNEHGIHKQASALQTTRGLLHRLKTT